MATRRRLRSRVWGPRRRPCSPSWPWWQPRPSRGGGVPPPPPAVGWPRGFPGPSWGTSRRRSPGRPPAMPASSPAPERLGQHHARTPTRRGPRCIGGPPLMTPTHRTGAWHRWVRRGDGAGLPRTSGVTLRLCVRVGYLAGPGRVYEHPLEGLVHRQDQSYSYSYSYSYIYPGTPSPPPRGPEPSASRLPRSPPPSLPGPPVRDQFAALSRWHNWPEPAVEV